MPSKSDELKAKLDALGVKYPKEARFPALKKLLAEAEAVKPADAGEAAPPEEPAEESPEKSAEEPAVPSLPVPKKVEPSERYIVVELNGRYYRKWFRKNGTTDMEFIGLEPPR